MRLEVRCFAGLAPQTPPGGLLDLPDGATVEAAIRQIGVTPADIKLIFVNGRHAEPDHPLADGDRLAFVPAVGGG